MRVGALIHRPLTWGGDRHRGERSVGLQEYLSSDIKMGHPKGLPDSHRPGDLDLGSVGTVSPSPPRSSPYVPASPWWPQKMDIAVICLSPISFPVLKEDQGRQPTFNDPPLSGMGRP